MPHNTRRHPRVSAAGDAGYEAQPMKIATFQKDVYGEKMSYSCTQIVSPSGKVVACVPELEQGCACARITV